MNMIRTNGRQLSHMAYAIIIYNLSIIFGAVSLPILSGSLLRLVALIIILFWIEKKLVVRMTWFNRIFLAYVGLMVFSLMYTLNITATVQRISTNFQFLILLIAVSSCKFGQNEIQSIKKSLIWCSRITAGVLLVAGGTGAGRLLLNGSLLAEDPNYLNGYFIFGIVGAMEVMINQSPTIRQRILAVAELALYIYCCLATGSRGGMFCLAAASLFYFFFGSNGTDSLKSKMKKIALAGIILFLISIAITYIPESVSNRFTMKAIVESNGTHRYEFWGWAVSIFKKSNIFHQLFGYGAGAIRTIFKSYGYWDVVAHNIFVEQLMEGGIMLNLVYIALLSYMLVKSFRRKDFFSVAVTIGFIVLSLSTSLYAFKPMWAIMMFINLRHAGECANEMTGYKDTYLLYRDSEG